jgi:septal ring factor EnvC (AmiA/AmiB activator)
VKGKAVLNHKLEKQSDKTELLEQTLKHANFKVQTLTENLNSSEKELKTKDKELNKMKTKSDNLED